MPNKQRKVEVSEAQGVLAQIKQRREAMQKERLHTMEIPGYSGMLLARYQPVPYEKLREIGERAEKGTHGVAQRELQIAADTLIHACRAILSRLDGKLEPITDGGEPVERFDKHLASALGIESPNPDRDITARETLFAVFPDELSVVAHFGEFTEWQGSGDADDDESLLGESKPTD